MWCNGVNFKISVFVIDLIISVVVVDFVEFICMIFYIMDVLIDGVGGIVSFGMGLN